ncbi:MAG TPA: PIN domain-containing protein [Thermoanaerobaculia bacterium]|nr:PIN domain-containing protein [Thermoanaerobaculia bacterium]
MPLPLLLDSNILSKIVHPVREHDPIVVTVTRLLQDLRYEIYVPEIVDYELRRKLLHLSQHPHQARRWARESLHYLDKLVAAGYVPLTTETMRLAAWLWADSRARGQSRGPDDSLDVDVILAAQANQAGAQIVTTNEKHFQGIAEVFDWRPFAGIS